jgi:hypothetical protein
MNFFKRILTAVGSFFGSKQAHAIEYDVVVTLAPVAESALAVAASSNAIAAAVVAGVIDPAINRAVNTPENPA